MKVVKEFKKFITRGNVIDMAIGIIIGTAFTAIVNSLVRDIFMPLIGLCTGGVDFSSWQWVVGNAEKPVIFNFGLLVSSILNFFIIALVVFAIVRVINGVRDSVEKIEKQKKEAADKLVDEKEAAEVVAPTTKICPFCYSEINVLASRCGHCTSQLVEVGQEEIK